jgi:predicted O-methyltransferase YrrM
MTTPVVYQGDKMLSSYAKNNYGDVFERIVGTHGVCRIVELGVLYGYSTIHLAKGLKDNKSGAAAQRHLDAYDLWEDYPYRHTTMSTTQGIIAENNLQDYVTLHKCDAFEAHNRHEDGSVCLLHVDISNTGETIRKIMDRWHPKIRANGIILFEGGSVERDNIEWMIKYNMPSLRNELQTNKIIGEFYTVKTYEEFPSLTALHKNKKNP